MIISRQQENEYPMFACLIASILSYKDDPVERNSIISSTLNRGNYAARAWSYLVCSDNVLNNHNYRGYAIINHTTNQIVIAHRGTQMDHVRTWLGTNYKLILEGNIPESYPAAKEFSQRIRQTYAGFTMYETGHSLGGMYAALNAHTFDCQAVMFDSPSLSKILHDREKRHQLRQADLNESNFVNYVVSPNVINTLGERRVGRYIRLFLQHSAADTGLHLGNAADIVTSASALLGLITANVARFAPSFLAFLATHSLEQTINTHNCLERILGVIDSELNEPLLQAEVTNWPSLIEFARWFLREEYSPWQYLSEELYDQVATRTRRIENSMKTKLSSYKLGKFIVPVFNTTHRSQTTDRQAEQPIINFFENMGRRLQIFFPRQSLQIAYPQSTQQPVMVIRSETIDDYTVLYDQVRDLVYVDQNAIGAGVKCNGIIMLARPSDDKDFIRLDEAMNWDSCGQFIFNNSAIDNNNSRVGTYIDVLERHPSISSEIDERMTAVARQFSPMVQRFYNKVANKEDNRFFVMPKMLASVGEIISQNKYERVNALEEFWRETVRELNDCYQQARHDLRYLTPREQTIVLNRSFVGGCMADGVLPRANRIQTHTSVDMRYDPVKLTPASALSNIGWALRTAGSQSFFGRFISPPSSPGANLPPQLYPR